MVEGVAIWRTSWVVIFFHTVCTFGGALDWFSQTSTIWDTGSVFSPACWSGVAREVSCWLGSGGVDKEEELDWMLGDLGASIEIGTLELCWR